jgi:hypothetical protein
VTGQRLSWGLVCGPDNVREGRKHGKHRHAPRVGVAVGRRRRLRLRRRPVLLGMLLEWPSNSREAARRYSLQDDQATWRARRQRFRILYVPFVFEPSRPRDLPLSNPVSTDTGNRSRVVRSDSVRFDRLRAARSSRRHGSESRGDLHFPCEFDRTNPQVRQATILCALNERPLLGAVTTISNGRYRR